MKSKITTLFILLSIVGFGQSVPNTTTFNLQQVATAVFGSAGTHTLSECFSSANAGYFDPTYNQNGYAPANSMLRFRNYNIANGTPTAPIVTTGTATNLIETGGDLAGNVTSGGTATVTERGIQVSVNSNMSGSVNYSTSGTTGSYSVSVSVLQCYNTLYYYRAYATNSVGTGYGEISSFTTANPSHTDYEFIFKTYYPTVDVTDLATAKGAAANRYRAWSGAGYDMNSVKAQNLNVGTMVYNTSGCTTIYSCWRTVTSGGNWYAIQIDSYGKISTSTAITPVTNTYTTSSTFNAPATATIGMVECWGGGGTGGVADGTGARAAGGAGGSYARKRIDFTASGSYVYTVGGASTASTTAKVDGKPTYFGNASFASATVGANGGLGGAVNTSTGGATATTASSSSGGGGASIGDVIRKGGDGGAGTSASYAGAGGSGAGSNYDGNSATNQTTGGATSENGGNGGAGTNTTNTRNNGSTYGGGGSGGIATTSTNRAGGNGAAGLIRVTYFQ